MLREVYKSEEIEIWEQPPNKRTIIIDDEKFFIQFPYVIFCIRRFGNYYYYYLSVFGSKESVINDRCLIFPLPLPNIKDNGVTCMGHPLVIKPNIKELVNEFWNSSFKRGEVRSGDNRWIDWYYGNGIPRENKLKDIFDMKKLFENCSVIAYEQPSTKRTIIVNNRSYFIQFPPIIFAIKADYCFYAYYGSPPFEENSIIYSLPLPNIDKDGSVCIKEAMSFNDIGFQPLHRMINLFWNSKFMTGEVFHGDKNWWEWKENGFLSLPYQSGYLLKKLIPEFEIQ